RLITLISLPALLLSSCAPPADPEPLGRPIAQTLTAQPTILPTAYGVPANFQGDIILRYPHFELRFLGTRLESSGPLPAHLLTFQVRNHSRSQASTISWHPGSGDGGSFSLDNRNYQFAVEPDALQIVVSPTF
ncbi:MAG: hypothetical protein O3A87_10275, partial [Verrucomicrobia bacterium]|nr:hypothetical protein [Verrucomicrobiota bacterium]